MKLYIAVPVATGGSMYWRLVTWLLRIRSACYIDIVEGGPVATNRNSIVHRFLASDADILWMVDSDMNPHIDGLDCGGLTLIVDAMARDDVDVVSGISFRIGAEVNGFPGGPVPCVTSIKGDGKDARKDDVIQRVFSAPPGLHEMRDITTGGACLAIKRRVLEDMKRRKQVYFRDHYEEDDAETLGCLTWSEDSHFIRTAQDLGHRFWVDTRIEWGHMKRMDLRDELTRAKELMARARQEATK